MKNSADLLTNIASFIILVAILLGLQSNGGRLSHTPPPTLAPTTLGPTTLAPTSPAPTLTPTYAPTAPTASG